MKNLLIIAAFFAFFAKGTAQPTSRKVWEITGQFLKAREEIRKDAYTIPKKDGESLIFSFYLFSDNGLVSDPNQEINDSDTMKLYRFCSLRYYEPQYILLTIRGDLHIFDMLLSLNEILEDAGRACKTFNLDAEQAFELIWEIIRVYQFNEKKWRYGCPISWIIKEDYFEQPKEKIDTLP